MPHRKIRFVLSIPLLAASLACAGPTADLPFGPWTRASNEPILSPQGTTWESTGTFNPAVVLHNGKFVMLYRAQDAAGTSRLGCAESKDGIHFTRRPDPVLSPETAYEKDGGVEDPRLQKFGDTYYLTYTAYNKKDAQLCLATSLDLLHWERKGVILPAYHGNWNVGWTKSGAIVPEKIDGKYWMYWLGTAPSETGETYKTDQMGLSWSTDLLHWTEATTTPVLPRRPGQFDSRVVEPGPRPSSPSRASSSSTTPPTTTSSTAQPSPSLTAAIPANSSPVPTRPSSPLKNNGKKSARSPTSHLLKPWF